MADRRQGERWNDDFLYEVPDAHAFRVDAGGGAGVMMWREVTTGT
jgi:hypothetical protein